MIDPLRGCRACQSTDLWRIRQVLEQTPDGARPLGPAYAQGLRGVEARGGFELIACAGCQRVEWFARQAQSAAPSGIVDSSGACAICSGQGSWQIPALAEVRTAGIWGETHPLALAHYADGRAGEGELTGEVCAACGWVQWRAVGLAEVDVRRTLNLHSDGARCTDCSDGELLVSDPFVEQGPLGLTPLPLVLTAWLGLFSRAVGHLGLVACRACGVARWHSSGIEKLVEDPKGGVERIRPKPSGLGGPYR